MGRNHQKIQRGYCRSREKEWTQAIVDEEYYDEQSETLAIGGGDPGIPALMAAALDREPAPVAEPRTLHIVEEAVAPPTSSPYEAIAAVATRTNAAGTARKLWRRLTRLMGSRH